MKRFIKWFAVAALAVVAVLAVIYRAVNKAPSADLSQAERVAAIFDDGGCISCHSDNPDLPFYAGWPVIGKIVKDDVALGYHIFDFTPVKEALEKGGDISPVKLAKIEKVVSDGSMPMAKYYLVHWGSSITKAKRSIVIDWAADQWQQKYGIAEKIVPIETISTDSAKVALGNILFHDTRLSVNNTISCASCHDLKTAGVDNEDVSDGVFDLEGGVNAPTVFNSVYNFVQFWDGRAETLAKQAAGPPLNPVEMGCQSFDEIVAKLVCDKEMVKMFNAIYPEGITEETITDAIAEFEKTLVTPDSRFDKYLKGDQTAINDQEKAGYDLFLATGCATCHNGPILGGQSYELMGVKADYFAERGKELTNEDNGRFKETQCERDRHRFKTPGLRNVALTWPYYHDATRATLEEAVRDMGKYQSGVKLSQSQISDMVAFLNTLTGEFEGQLLTNENDINR
ncbi:MAG: cytochrome-c peroxidase [Bacteroidales bacterium]|nr:cytochrome-c peroxidase [Bacteroidales bacterium]